MTNIPTKTPKSSNRTKHNPTLIYARQTFVQTPNPQKTNVPTKNSSHKANNQNPQRGPTLLYVHSTSLQIPRYPKTINSAAQSYSSTPHFRNSSPNPPKPNQKHLNQNLSHMANEHPESPNRQHSTAQPYPSLCTPLQKNPAKPKPTQQNTPQPIPFPHDK